MPINIIMGNTMNLKKKDLIAIEDTTANEIELVFRTADSMKEMLTRKNNRTTPTLAGKTIVNLFYEPSTRTRTSFELAEKRLHATTINIFPGNSSMVKGETLRDTGKNLQAMNPDLIVIRHPAPGAAKILADTLPASIINAGDGAHEHPTQALLDLFTIREKKGRLKGLKAVIIGDIAHSRVARSNIWGMKKMGMRVRVAGPSTMIPPGLGEMGVEVSHDVERAIEDMDVIMCLRIQLERQKKVLVPSLREYARFFGITPTKMKKAKKKVVIMHPGPLNRGVEISPEVADGPHSLILDQVTNGVAVRMALLYLLSGGGQ